MALAQHRREPPRARNICRIACAGADRLDLRKAKRIALLASGERAACEHADADRADAVLRGKIENAAVILRRKGSRDRLARTRIERIVRHLRGVERAGRDQAVQRRGFADRREADVACLALLARAREGGHHVAEHFVGAHGLPVARADHVVQLKNVDMIALQPSERCIERGRDRGTDVAPPGGQAHLGRGDGAGILLGDLEPLTDHLRQRPIGHAVAVRGRGVEMIDASFERTRDRALLIGGRPACHQSADRAATEGQHRDVKSSTPEFSCLHGASVARIWREAKSGLSYVGRAQARITTSPCYPHGVARFRHQWLPPGRRAPRTGALHAYLDFRRCADRYRPTGFRRAFTPTCAARRRHSPRASCSSSSPIRLRTSRAAGSNRIRICDAADLRPH